MKMTPFYAEGDKNQTLRLRLSQRPILGPVLASVLRQKSLYFEYHSGLDQACPVLDTGESNDFNWIPAFAGMTTSELM